MLIELLISPFLSITSVDRASAEKQAKMDRIEEDNFEHDGAGINREIWP
jgi:hypothetical protein